MPRPGRSRSPNLEVISRAIAGFGRYPDKRPRGLAVDRDGTIFLEDLMRCWGNAEGFSEDAVLNAARQHMFHDDQRRDMRFVIDCNTRGQMTIRVMPKRHHRGAASTPDRCGASWRDRSRPTPPHVAAPFRRRERGGDRVARNEPFEPKFQAPAGPPPQAATMQPLATEKKLDMGLDDIISRERRPAPPLLPAVHSVASYKAAPPLPPPLPKQSSPLDGGSARGKGDRVRHMFAQMGHTRETHHVRHHSQHGNGARPQQQPQQWQRQRGGIMSASEKLQRWVSWVMKRGYSELGVAIDTSGREGGANCRARLGELAETMRRTKPEFGEFDARSLQTALEESNHAGRFVFSDGYVRLVARADRLAQVSQRSPSSVLALGAGPSDPPGRRSRSSSLASSTGSSRGNIGGTAHSFSIATPRGPACERHDSSQAPPPPPWGGNSTDVWTVYHEDGKNWWYYKGPLGEWACLAEGEPPTRC